MEKLQLSDLYRKLIENSLTEEERMLLAKMVKTVAVNYSLNVQVYDQTKVIDLRVKENRINF